MSREYCNTSHTFATITVNTGTTEYTAQFDSPPLTVFTGNSSQTVSLLDRWNNNSLKLLFAIPGNWSYGTTYNALYSGTNGGTLNFWAGLGSASNKLYSIFFDETAAIGINQGATRYDLLVQSSTDKMISAYDGVSYYGWEVQDTSAYTVKCDGCLPSETRVNKAKYPGYYCLDCEAIDSRLRRIGDKLDGANR